MDFELMMTATPKLAAGVPTTVLLASVGLAVGFAIALPTAVGATSKNGFVRGTASGYIFLFRSTPLLVQLFLIYFGLGQLEAVRESFLWPVLKSPMWCSIIALALNTGAFTAEILRGAFLAVPRGELEAARAGGMSRAVRFRRITFPIGMRLALQSYGNEMVMLVKATALASTVTVFEITGIAHKLIAETYRPIEIFIIAGALYLALNFCLTRGLGFAEHRLTPHLR